MKEFAKRDLSKPIGCGRIYKIVPKGKKPKAITIPNDPALQVALLGHTSGFIRDLTQQTMVDQKNRKAIPLLKAALKNTNNPMQVIHAMWVLEGLYALQTNELTSLMQNPNWVIRTQALTAAPSVINQSSYTAYLPILKQLLANDDQFAAPYVAYVSNYLKPFNEQEVNQLLLDLARKYPDNSYVVDAIVSTIPLKEDFFQKSIGQFLPDTALKINKQLSRVISNFRASQKNRDPEVIARAFPKGAALFRSTCQTCHAADGNGIKSLAPPLNKSEWVTGDKNRLLPIVMYGLTGPIKVNDHLYGPPEISADMPGIAHAEEISDEDIAQVLSFIRSSWQNNAGPVDAKDIKVMREKYKGRESAFTQEELNNIK